MEVTSFVSPKWVPQVRNEYIYNLYCIVCIYYLYYMFMYQCICTSLQSMASARASFFRTSSLCMPKWAYRTQNTKFILNYWIKTFYFTVNVVSQFLIFLSSFPKYNLQIRTIYIGIIIHNDNTVTQKNMNNVIYMLSSAIFCRLYIM